MVVLCYSSLVSYVNKKVLLKGIIYDIMDEL